MKRIYPIAIIIIVLAISSVLVLTQYKSYHVIKDQIIPTTSGQSMDITFTIENVEKPWKVQFNIKAEYGDLLVGLYTAQDELLWFENMYNGDHEYEFIHTGELLFRVRVPSYMMAQEITLTVLEWKPLLG